MSAVHMTFSQRDLPVIIFVHVPKTAGTSFRQWLVEYFSGNVLFHPDSRQIEADARSDAAPFLDRGYLARGANARDLKWLFKQYGTGAFDGYQAIGGHIRFDFPFVAAIERPAVICSAVRDPVERIISVYNWARLNKLNPMHACVDGRTLFQSLQAKGRFLKEADNKQMNCIFGKKRRMSFNRVRPNNGWTMVCRYDRYDKLTQRIADMYGKPISEFPHRNRVREPYKDEIYAQPDFKEAVDLIKELNAEEVAFVESVGEFIELHPPQ